MPRYVAYKGTRYEYKTTVPNKKKLDGKVYELVDIFPNYAGLNGHRTAVGMAKDLRQRGKQARIDAHSGFTAVYSR